MNVLRSVLAIVAIIAGTFIARAQFQPSTNSGIGAPGGPNAVLQFDTNGMFGGIAGVTSDQANVGFATSSALLLYGVTAGNCLATDANHKIVDSGGTCGGTGSPGGSNGQVQFNTNGGFGGISGATSNANSISFTTNSLIINGQAISKVSGTTGTLASVTGTLGSGHCVQIDAVGNLIDSGTAACGGLTAFSIAAGSNITTSGTASNVTVNVVATPTFTSVTTTLAAISGWLTAPGVSMQTATIAGNLTGATASFSGNLTGTTAQFSGTLTGVQAVFQTITDSGLGASTQCLQSIAGVINGTSSVCATATSIAAGSNITTSGTASNVTVNVVATPTFSSVTAGSIGITGTALIGGFLTAAGTSLQTATIIGNLTAQTAAIPGWLTASGANLSTATIAGALIGSTANFSGNLTGTTAQFSGLVTGTTGTFQTHTGATLNLSGNLTGTTAQFSGAVTGTTATFQTVTAQNFTTVAAGFVGIPAAGSGTAFLRGDNTFSTPTTLGLTTSQGWVNWNGETRTAADSVGLITTGMANIMQINVNAGKTYKFNAELPIRANAATGSIAIRVGGGATATAVVYDGWIVDSANNGIKANTQATALSTTVAGSTVSGTTGHISLVGTITVNAAGTLIVQAGSFTTVTAAAAMTIGRGATFVAEDIP